MKKTHLCLALAVLCGSVTPATSQAVKRAGAAPHPTTPAPAKSITALQTPPPDVEPGAKVVAYGEKDIVKVKTKLRYTTLIVLPKNEQVLDYTCGDKEYVVGMDRAVLRVDGRAFYNRQEVPLHALPRYVRALSTAFAPGYLVYLVQEHDA